MTDKYKQEVIDPGDEASRIAKEICFQSHKNCQAIDIIPHQPGNFRGPVSFAWQREILDEFVKDTMFESFENDGAGGKPQFFTFMGTEKIFKNLGWEIIVMCADDFARTGRFPCIMINDINIKYINQHNLALYKAMMQGYGKALKEANLVNITGELAIMKHCITAFCEDQNLANQLILTWSGSCLGLFNQSKFITGSDIKSGMPIVGLWEQGYRCNGGTFFTNLLLKTFGTNVSKLIMNLEARAFVEKLTVPSRLYSPLICDIIGWRPTGTVKEPKVNILGISHITGGGVWGKLPEMLPPGIGADLNAMPKPAEVLLEAQEMSWNTDLRLTDWQAYSTLHGGCGMLLVLPDEKAANTFLELAANDGYKAFPVGQTIDSDKKEIIIKSRFKQGLTLSSVRET